jgi:hypothetical protein
MNAIAAAAPWVPAVPEWLQKLKSFMSSFVSNAGFANITAAWHAYASRPLYIGWGTGSGQTATSTNLATAANESRVTGTSSQQTTSVTNDTYQVTGTLTAGGARAITEVGVFDAAGSGNPPSGGNLAIYGDHSVINLATNDSIAYTIKVKFS